MANCLSAVLEYSLGELKKTLGNFALASSSSAIDYVPVAVEHPATDFFGNPRPTAATPGDGRFDVGAVESQ